MNWRLIHWRLERGTRYQSYELSIHWKLLWGEGGQRKSLEKSCIYLSGASTEWIEAIWFDKWGNDAHWLGLRLGHAVLSSVPHCPHSPPPPRDTFELLLVGTVLRTSFCWTGAPPPAAAVRQSAACRPRMGSALERPGARTKRNASISWNIITHWYGHVGNDVQDSRWRPATSEIRRLRKRLSPAGF